MTLDDIGARLPNGFHDCYLGKLSADFIAQTLSLEVDLLLGEDDAPAQYKLHLLWFEGVSLLHFEPPVNYRKIGKARGLAMDVVAVQDKDKQLFKEMGYGIPAENFWCAFFVYEWNSRLIINASGCRLTDL